MAKKNLTGFIGFHTSPALHLRAYVHKSGLEVFNANESDGVIEAIRYAMQTLAGENVMGERTRQTGFIAAVWGFKDGKMVDITKMTYSAPAFWKKNSTGKTFVFQDEIYQPDRAEHTCGDGYMMLGREEEHRRNTMSMRDYFRSPSPLGIKIIS